MTATPSEGGSALDALIHYMERDGYGTPIGICERVPAARLELAELRAALREARDYLDWSRPTGMALPCARRAALLSTIDRLTASPTETK